MKSTVRAVADEIASAAELALGKTAGRRSPWSAARDPDAATAAIADVIMPPEIDLFR